jgi:glycosyltransferase involved in cell wall biosynthesis
MDKTTPDLSPELAQASSYCLMVPHYNHHQQFALFLPEILSSQLPCIIIDDGSDPHSLSSLKKTLADQTSIYLYEHGYNRGKGAAIKTGICHARAQGFTHAIQIDADGQHNVNDIPSFITLSKQHPNSIICGKPIYDVSVPKARLYGRKITDFWVMLETLSLTIKDSLCGFRVYPIKNTEAVFDHYYIGNRMDVDTEILVKACWLSFELKFIDTLVIYPEQNISHFHYLRDNLLLIRLHLRLMTGMLIRLPKLLLAAIRRATQKSAH